jgi:DNA-binding IclR family transcriptional regulator
VRDGWVFLTNHAVVLLAIADDPESRLRDLATRTGLTERAVFDIVDDLCAAGYLTKTKVGRRVNYSLHPQGLRRPGVEIQSLYRLIELVQPSASTPQR